MVGQANAAFHETNAASHDTNAAIHSTKAASHNTNAAAHDTNAASHETTAVSYDTTAAFHDKTATPDGCTEQVRSPHSCFSGFGVLLSAGTRRRKTTPAAAGPESSFRAERRRAYHMTAGVQPGSHPEEGDNMIAQQIRKFDMLRRVQQFLDEFAVKLFAESAAAARKELDQLVEEMGVNETAQASGTLNAKSQTATQAVLRRGLVNHHMRPVATIAAAHLRDVPGFKAFQVPKVGVKVAVLVQDATAMAEAAREYQEVFVGNGRPENFADALLAAAGAVRASIDARAKNIASKAAARGGLKATATRAHLVLRFLDAQVKSAAEDDPKTLAAWNSAKRIGKGKVVPIEATIPAPTTSELKAA